MFFEIDFSWAVTSCSVVVRHQRFGGPWYFHLQGEVKRDTKVRFPRQNQQSAEMTEGYYSERLLTRCAPRHLVRTWLNARLPKNTRWENETINCRFFTLHRVESGCVSQSSRGWQQKSLRACTLKVTV